MHFRAGIKKMKPWERKVIRVINLFIYHLAKHWLLLVNLAVALYVFPAIGAPLLMWNHYERPARAIYFFYSFACHQLPERSFFIGPHLTYSLDEIRNFIGEQADSVIQRRRFIGNEEVGYKMAMCQRDIAIYLTILMAGIAFTFVRKRLEPLSFRSFLVLCIPIAVDGITQLMGLRESTPPGRVFSGALFGIALVWLTYPRLEMAFEEIRKAAATNLGRTLIRQDENDTFSTTSR
ncbi:MAG TPA: DUF2085 domain-containing protein [Chloroflexi bacterium]|nr:DUF2085 domain-containing protein [Chloroflexota bacterium]